MTSFRPSRSDNHLSNYWNALVRHAPPEELARLARLVEPSEIAAIERARAAHQRYEPDPVFARRLEQTIMDATFASIADTIPQPRVSLPSRNGARDPGPVSRRRALPPPSRTSWTLRPAVAIGLVIMLILASVGGVWLLNTGQDEPHRLLAPVVSTPSAEDSLDMPMYRANPERTGVMPGPGIEGEPVQLWRAEVAGIIETAPVLVDGVLYLGAGDGGLYAYDATSGEQLWIFQGDSPIMSSPAVQDGIVYAGSTDGALYAIDAATGTEVWSFPGAQSEVAVAIVGNAVYTGGGDGFLYALDAATGKEFWRAPLDAEASRSPAVSDGVVYMGSTDGVLHTFDAETGEPGWTRKLVGEGILTTTVVYQGVVYEGIIDSAESRLFALDAATGEDLWIFESESGGGFYSATTDGQTVYTGSDDNNFYALDAATGEELWRFEGSEDVRSASALVGDTLYVSAFDGYLYAIDAATGAEHWRFAIEGEVFAGPVVSGGVAYLGTTFGYFYAISGTGEAATPMASPPETLQASPSASPAAATEIIVEPLWQTTGGPDPLLVPTGMAVAPDGTIWVVDSGNNRFQLFSPDGEYLETWGTPGDGEGEFNFSPNPDNPNDSVGGITFDSEGNFYVGDAANQRIQKFDADRNFLLSWGTEGEGEGQFLLPYWPVVAPDGNVYVVDGMRGDVQVFSPEGEFLYQLAGRGAEDHQLSSIGALGIADNGTVHVTDAMAGTIKTFAADGTYVDTWGGFGVDEGELRGPTSVAIDAVGNVYVTDLENGRVQVFNPDQEFITLWSQADAAGNPFVAPIVVAIDDAGGVYVTDVGAGTVQKFEVTLPVTTGATPVS